MIDDEILREIAARASTLDERVAGSVLPAAAVSASDRARAARRLAAWRSVAAGGDGVRFARRLAADGIDEHAAIRLLGPVTLSAGAPLPSWAETLGWVAAAIMAGPAAATIAASEPPKFAYVLQSGADAAARRLGERIGTVPEHVLAPAAREALERSLLSRLIDACAPAFRAEVAIFHHRTRGPTGRVPGSAPASPREHDEAFAFGCRRDFPALLRAKPVIGRIIGTIVEQWLDGTSELIGRLVRDLPALSVAFGAGASLGRVEEVAADVGDKHRQGRGVVMLGLSTGRRIVYKPRDMNSDAAWVALSRWLAENGAPVVVEAPQVLIREGYGWTEYIEADLPGRVQPDHGLHRRAGALLAVLRLLNASDMHRDNVIVRAGAPVAIDLETLMEPRLAPELITLPAGAADRMERELAADSVSSVGLLPVRLRGPDGRWEEMGGLSGMLPASAELPAAVDAVLSGFTDTYEFLLLQRDRLLAPSGPLALFESLAVRAVLASTRDYGIVRNHARRLANLTDGADWSMQFDALGRHIDLVAAGDFAWHLLAAERRALARLDIPYFFARSDDHWIEGCDGRRLDACLAEAPRDRLRRRLFAYGAEDLAHQQRLIRTALLDRDDPLPTPAGS